MSEKTKKNIIRAVKFFIFILVLIAISGTLKKAWEQFTTADMPLHFSWIWLMVSALCYSVALVFPALFWHSVLHQWGQRPALQQSIRAHIIGHLGKYIPGKVMVVLIRAGLISGKKVDSTVAVVSVFLETLVQMATGAFLAVLVLAVHIIHTGDVRMMPLASGLLLVAGLPTIPAFFKKIVKLTGAKRFSDQISRVNDLNWRTLGLGWCLLCLFWLFLGVSYWAILRGLGLDISFWVNIPQCVAVSALAMVAGFVLVIAPGGLGVREIILIPLMAPLLDQQCVPGYGEAAAALSAVALRLCWMAVEVVLAAVLYFPFKTCSLREKTSDADQLIIHSEKNGGDERQEKDGSIKEQEMSGI